MNGIDLNMMKPTIIILLILAWWLNVLEISKEMSHARCWLRRGEDEVEGEIDDREAERRAFQIG